MPDMLPLDDTQSLSVAELTKLASTSENIEAHLDRLFRTLEIGGEEQRAWVSDCLTARSGWTESGVQKLVELAAGSNLHVAVEALRTLTRATEGMSAAQIVLCQEVASSNLVMNRQTAIKQEAIRLLTACGTLSGENRRIISELTSSSDPRLARLADRALQ